METKKKLRFLDIEEDKVNRTAFIFASLAAVEAFIMVTFFLDGPLRNAVILLMPVCGFLTRCTTKKIKWLRKYEKYVYMSLPFWASIILVVDGEGRFGAISQLYFMWLGLAVAYYDVKLVLFCSGFTIFCTAGTIWLFPEAMLKIDNLTTWTYILVVYIMATILTAITANRMRNLLNQAKKARVYEDELIYLEQLEKKEEKHSEFIHNINHYFNAIGELAREEHCQQIMNLMEELNTNLMQNERIIYTNHKLVNAILSEKMNEATDMELDFDAYVEPGVSLGQVKDSDLVSMLGNLLDNAFEAGKQCVGEKRKITLRIYMEKDGKVCAMKLMNYFVKKPRRHKSVFVTSKKEKALHGIGIKSVENTIEKYDGYLQCLVGDETFTSILILPITQ
ncbi:MAG: GHKL domain-containing protein [Lachnospiraceae bacterium]|nr:GHKL domain-containing protein [Lachnospiraceae bacterium]